MIAVDPRNPKGIVWLASYPKSGNTWLRIFLYQLMRIMGGHPREADELNKLDRSSMYEAKLFGLFNRILGKPLATATREEVTNVRPLVHATIVDRIRGSVSLVKTHNLLGDIGGVPILNFDVSVGAIYIVRDPRDVAPSLAGQMRAPIDATIKIMGQSAFATGNSEEAAFETWGSWSEHVTSWTMTPSPVTLVVRYEDMIGKPTETFAAIAKHLRQQPTPEQIAEAIELSSFDKLKQQEDQYDFRERPVTADRFFESGKAGGWRDKLTDRQAQAIADAHGAVMRKFGYLD
jgi:hypothetical protein